MKHIKITFEIIWKNKYTLLLLLLQMLLTTIIFVSLVGKLQYLVSSRASANAFNEYNAYYFNNYLYYDPEVLDLEQILQEQINAEWSIGETAILHLQTSDGKMVMAYGYNEPIITLSNIEMHSGTWFAEGEDYGGVPVIAIGDTYKTGDTIEFWNPEQERKTSVKVIGTISPQTYVTAFSSGASQDFAKLYQLIEPAQGDFIVPFECKNIPSVTNADTWMVQRLFGKIIVTEDKMPQDEIYRVLKPYGTVSNIGIMQENYKHELREYFISNGVVLFVFTLLALAGIGGINSMLNLVNERRYTIYFMHGMTKRNCALVEAMRSGTLILLSYLLFFVLYAITPVGEIFSVQSYTINGLTFLAVLLYMILIYSITAVPFVIKLGKKDLIHLYKQKS